MASDTDQDVILMRKAASSVSVFIAIVGILANVVTLVAVRLAVKEPKARHKFMASLNIADSVIAVIATANSMIASHSTQECPTDIQSVILCLRNASYLLVLGTIALIAFDMYVAICKPLQYMAILTPRKTLTMIVILWILSITIGLGELCLIKVLMATSQKHKCDESIKITTVRYGRISRGVFCGLSSVIGIICYVLVLFEVKRMPEQVHPMACNRENQCKNSKKESKKALVTILLIVGTCAIFMGHFTF